MFDTKVITTTVKWKAPTTVHSPKKIYGSTNKVAAVDKDTDQIIKIYTNVIEAARSILVKEYFTFSPSYELVKETAANIAEAADHYHKVVLGYYWKWIN